MGHYLRRLSYFSASLLMVAIVVIMAFSPTVSAIIQPPGGDEASTSGTPGTFSDGTAITAHFIDQNLIWVQFTGYYYPAANQYVDLSYLNHDTWNGESGAFFYMSASIEEGNYLMDGAQASGNDGSGDSWTGFNGECTYKGGNPDEQPNIEGYKTSTENLSFANPFYQLSIVNLYYPAWAVSSSNGAPELPSSEKNSCFRMSLPNTGVGNPGGDIPSSQPATGIVATGKNADAAGKDKNPNAVSIIVNNQSPAEATGSGSAIKPGQYIFQYDATGNDIFYTGADPGFDASDYVASAIKDFSGNGGKGQLPDVDKSLETQTTSAGSCAGRGGGKGGCTPTVTSNFPVYFTPATSVPVQANGYALFSSSYQDTVGCSDILTPQTPASGDTTGLPASLLLDPSNLNGQCATTGTGSTVNVLNQPTLQTAGATPTAAASASDGSSGASPTINCSVAIFNPLSWFLCPLAAGLESIAGGLDNEINSIMTINTPGSPSDINQYQTAWASVRDIALGLIVIAGLVAIISQAAGFEFLDAYTIQKALPRIVIVAIGISLSWPLLSWFITLTNDLGLGVRSLIYLGSTGHTNVDLGGGGQVVAAIIGAGAIEGLGFVGLLSFAATAALAASVAFLVLTLRQMIIVLLVIFSPIAIACYVLPHTQRVWKIWWESFSKGLLMFPLITGLIALGRVFASISSSGGSIDQILGFVAYFAPYFLIPLTFRLAGGAIANIGGFVNDRHRGAFDGLRNFRKNQSKKKRAELAQRARTGRIFRQAPKGSLRSKINSGVTNATLVGQAGYNPAMMAANIRAARAKNEAQHVAKAAETSSAYSLFMGNDDMLEAAQIGRRSLKDAQAYLTSKGYADVDAKQGVGLIRQAQNDLGKDTLALAAAQANMGTSTGYKGGAGEAFDALMKAADGDMAVATSLYAGGRSKAEQARRFDLLGGGFTDGLQHMQRIAGARTDDERNAAIQRANVESADMALETQGIGAVLGGKGHSGKNMAPAMQRRLLKSQSDMMKIASGALDAPLVPQTDENGNEVRDADNNVVMRPKTMEEAQREWVQNMASTSVAIDNAGSAAPEVARLLADTVHNGRITLSDMPPELRSILATNADGTQSRIFDTNPDGSVKLDANGVAVPATITYSQAMSKLEGLDAYGQMKKVYLSQLQQAQGALGVPLAGAPGAGGPLPGALPPAG